MTPADLAIVSPYPTTQARAVPQSGVAPYTSRLAAALAEEGLNVRVIAPRVDGEPASSEHGKVRVERCYKPGPGALPTAAAAARRGGAQVVHVQYETFLFGGPASLAGLPPALASLRRHGYGPVVTLHQVVQPSSVDREFTRLHRVSVPQPLARWGLHALQSTVRTLSAVTLVHEPGFLSVVPEAVVVPVGLDLAEPNRSTEVKPALGLNGEALTALCFGFVAPYKGLEVALEAAELAGPAVQLVVAGGSHPRLAGRDPYAESLRQRYAHVARFEGYVPDSRVERWFAAADVLLLPYPKPFSSSGPFALALGFGTPVLCSPPLARCLGVPPLMQAPLEPVGLAARLRALAGDRSQLRDLALAGRALAEGRAWDHVARRHVAVYEGVIDARRPPRRRVQSGRPGG